MKVHDVFSTPPDFVNEEGVKWWKDQDTQDYADTKNVPVQCWLVEMPNTFRERVLVSNGGVVYANTSMEAVACWIDVQTMLG